MLWEISGYVDDGYLGLRGITPRMQTQMERTWNMNWGQTSGYRGLWELTMQM